MHFFIAFKTDVVDVLLIYYSNDFWKLAIISIYFQTFEIWRGIYHFSLLFNMKVILWKQDYKIHQKNMFLKSLLLVCQQSISHASGQVGFSGPAGMEDWFGFTIYIWERDNSFRPSRGKRDWAGAGGVGAGVLSTFYVLMNMKFQSQARWILYWI